jgi:small subunit ribosomal protein S1
MSVWPDDNSITKIDMMDQFLDEHTRGRLKRGQVVDGEIIRIENEGMFVDVGSKRDAFVPRKDIESLDDEIIANMNSGDLVPVEIYRVPIGEGDLIASITKGFEQKDWEHAQECFEIGEILTSEVEDWNQGGLLVRFGELRGFVPNSHLSDLGYGYSREESEECKAGKIGTMITLKVIEVNRERNRLILSEKAVEHEMRRRKLEELSVGEVIPCIVLNVVDYGVFVDIGGITGLIHVSELTWKRVNNPKSLFSDGVEVFAKVIGVDVERERIRLSCKALQPNPWDTIKEQHQEGDWVDGYVTGIKDYGAFVKLPSGFEGLIHISEMPNEDVISPHKFFEKGENVRVRILKIDPERERISLSLLNSSDDEGL